MTLIEFEKRNSLVLSKYKNISQFPRYLALRKRICSFNSSILLGCLSEDVSASLVMDVPRAVEHPVSRERVGLVLGQLYYHLGDYGQGLSYIAAFAYLFADKNEQVVGFILYVVNDLYKFNIWKGDLLNLHADIAVLEYLADDDTKNFMRDKGLRYEFFVQKYFYPLFVKAFDSEKMLWFFDHFLSNPSSIFYIINYIVRSVSKRWSQEGFIVVLKKMAELDDYDVENFEPGTLAPEKINEIRDLRVLEIKARLLLINSDEGEEESSDEEDNSSDEEEEE